MGGMSKGLSYILREVGIHGRLFNWEFMWARFLMTLGQFYGNQSLYGTTGIFEGKKKKAGLPLPKMIQTLKHF